MRRLDGNSAAFGIRGEREKVSDDDDEGEYDSFFDIVSAIFILTLTH